MARHCHRSLSLYVVPPELGPIHPRQDVVNKVHRGRESAKESHHYCEGVKKAQQVVQLGCIPNACQSMRYQMPQAHASASPQLLCSAQSSIPSKLGLTCPRQDRVDKGCTARPCPKRMSISMMPGATCATLSLVKAGVFDSVFNPTKGLSH